MKKEPWTLRKIKSKRQLRVGMVVVLGYEFQKKREYTMYRPASEQDREDYARFWEWAVNEGVVWEIVSRRTI